MRIITEFWGMGVPPDTTLAKSSSRVLEAVNRRVRLFSTTGTIMDTQVLNKFFGAVDGAGNPVGAHLFDPKVFYDRNATRPRYYAVALQTSSNPTRMSRIYVAISKSPNPGSLTSGWCRYWWDTRLALGPTADTWADYPGLGVGRDALVINTNQFDWSDDFVGGAIWALQKGPLNNNATTCPNMPQPYLWTADAAQDLLPHDTQPTQHYTTPTSATGILNPAYLINTYQGTTSYGMWRIANVASGNPLLWGPKIVIGSHTNSAPPTAPGGLNAPIDAGDTRMLQVAGLGDSLTGVHTTRCQFTTGTSAEACVRMVRFSVGATPTGTIAVQLTQQLVSGGGDGWYYFYPSVAVNNAGTAVSAFDVSTVGGYLGTAWAVKTSSQTTFSSVVYLAQGTCLRDTGYDSGAGYYRGGDYSGAAADPDGIRVWVAAERSAQFAGVGCGWQTRIAAITP